MDDKVTTFVEGKRDTETAVMLTGSEAYMLREMLKMYKEYMESGIRTAQQVLIKRNDYLPVTITDAEKVVKMGGNVVQMIDRLYEKLKGCDGWTEN